MFQRALPRKRVQLVAAIGVTMAVSPIILGLRASVWPAVHVTGGAMALFALVVEGWRLPRPQRILAAIGVAISIAVISIVTGGGSLSTTVQIAVFVVLATIYVAVVFMPLRNPH